MVSKVFTGGAELERRLSEIAKKVKSGKEVSVGFQNGATYADGTPVAYVAAIHEYGATINVPQHTTTIYRKLKNDLSFARKGRFVKLSQSNFATTHTVPAHQIRIPARPFFRLMIAKYQNSWSAILGNAVVSLDYDGAQALGVLGSVIEGELKGSIRDIRAPANAASTVAKKGFDNPLIHTGYMLNSVTYSVKT